MTLTNLGFLINSHKNTTEDIYCLLFYAGYLTFTGRTDVTHEEVTYELKIPNEEIMLMFKHDIVPRIKEQMCKRAKSLPQNTLYHPRVFQQSPHWSNRVFGFHAQLQALLLSGLFSVEGSKEEGFYVDMESAYDKISVKETGSITPVLEGKKGYKATRCDRDKTRNESNIEQHRRC